MDRPVVRFISVQFSSVPRPIGSSEEHEERFSRRIHLQGELSFFVSEQKRKGINFFNSSEINIKALPCEQIDDGARTGANASLR